MLNSEQVLTKLNEILATTIDTELYDCRAVWSLDFLQFDCVHPVVVNVSVHLESTDKNKSLRINHTFKDRIPLERSHSAARQANYLEIRLINLLGTRWNLVGIESK